MHPDVPANNSIEPHNARQPWNLLSDSRCRRYPMPFLNERLKHAAAANAVSAPARSCSPSLNDSNSRKLLAATVPPLTCRNARVFEISGCRTLSQTFSTAQIEAAAKKNTKVRFITIRNVGSYLGDL